MSYVSDLRGLSSELQDAASLAGDSTIEQSLGRATQAVDEISASWSGSSFGFHSRIYYEGFNPPPPGAHFDNEWGFQSDFHGTTGEWREYSAAEIKEKLRGLSDDADIGPAKLKAEEATKKFKEAKAEAISILSAFLEFVPDTYIMRMKAQVETQSIPTARSLALSCLPQGNVMSRDTTALSQGLHVAEHQRLWAEVTAVKESFKACEDLAFLLDRSANHIERKSTTPAIATRQTGESVFIGHGRSLVWRELKDFIADRLKLPYDEFNRVPVAGVTTVTRISEMLDKAALAFLIMTAEDETSEGTIRARQNVIHEVGLFQGRLGFERAIVMLEEGCEDFSNIDGLSQIRFPRGSISAAFEDVRLVLEREGLLER
ncbi:TIR domain-containing protein [Streptomyces sp. NPDC060006]|uniref:TIR domain-containing protein n=1 Tax=unclassified Streptomyces TaxID=2593676 RepID=UPI0036775A26